MGKISEKQKLQLEKERFEFEKQKFKWETETAKRGYRFRTYIVPLTSILITLIVTFIGIMSYLQQKHAKETELKLAEEKTKQEFNEKKRKELAEYRQEFESFAEKNRAALISPSIKKRIFITDIILKRFSTNSPNLIVDYFRTFRNEETPNENPSGDEKSCEDACECKESVSEYYKRACLMNHIRKDVNAKITVFLSDSNKAEEILGDEGFKMGLLSQSNQFSIEIPSIVPTNGGEIIFFYEQDETFANTIEERLDDFVPGVTFKKIYKPEIDYQNWKKILVIVPTYDFYGTRVK